MVKLEETVRGADLRALPSPLQGFGKTCRAVEQISYRVPSFANLVRLYKVHFVKLKETERCREIRNQSSRH